jgi:hypothetical protein
MKLAQPSIPGNDKVNVMFERKRENNNIGTLRFLGGVYGSIRAQLRAV